MTVRKPILFKPVTFHDTTNGVPIVGTVDGIKRDKNARGFVVTVFVPDPEEES